MLFILRIHGDYDLFVFISVIFDHIIWMLFFLLLTSNFSHRIYVLPIAEAIKEGRRKRNTYWQIAIRDNCLVFLNEGAFLFELIKHNVNLDLLLLSVLRCDCTRMKLFCVTLYFLFKVLLLIARLLLMKLWRSCEDMFLLRYIGRHFMHWIPNILCESSDLELNILYYFFNGLTLRHPSICAVNICHFKKTEKGCGPVSCSSLYKAWI